MSTETNPNRETLGQIVRKVWIAWALEQPVTKESWLVPWEGLKEPDKEVDRMIGETISGFCNSWLHRHINDIAQELDELKAWKAEQMQVGSMCDMQNLGKMLGIGIGESIHANLIPKVAALQQRLAAAEKENETLKNGTREAAPKDQLAEIRADRDSLELWQKDHLSFWSDGGGKGRA